MSGPESHHVLLVEDNDLNRALVKAVLARSDHPISRNVTLIEAGGLAAARAALAAAPVQLILLDMHLPDGHGLTLAEELTRPNVVRPIIIALTASALTEQQQAAHAAGCDDFLAKPFRPQQLIDLLNTHLPPAEQS
jgi:CheY-like chemotaxis protein